MVGIYKITSPSGKVYIGQSINIKKRWNYYKNSISNKQRRLNYSILKHGYDNHLFEVIEECNVDVLNDRERYWQDFFNCTNIKTGLNCRLTSSCDKTGKLSDDTILRIKENRKGKGVGRVLTDQTKLKIKIANTGKKATLSARQNMSKAQTGLKRSPEAVNKSILSRRGMKMSEDAKNKISVSQTGGSNSFAKIVLNIETGIFYETAKEAAESIGWTYNRINHYMNGRTKRKLPFIYI